MTVHHFLNPDLRAETFFEKEGAVENRGVDFKMGHIGTSAYLYWRLKKFYAEPVCNFIVFLLTKK